MRPGNNGELIFEGTTEARVASEFLSDMKKSNKESVNFSALVGLEAQLEQPRIGRLDFIGRRLEDACGTSDQTEYVIADADEAWIALHALQVATIPTNILFPIVPGVVRRDTYMSKRIDDYMRKSTDPEE